MSLMILERDYDDEREGSPWNGLDQSANLIRLVADLLLLMQSANHGVERFWVVCDATVW